jgi:hypothetical protein
MTSEFDRYLKKRRPWESDPQAKHWLDVLADARTYALNFRQELDGLVWQSPEIFLTYLSQRGEKGQRSAKFESVLNDGLIEHGYRSETIDDERLRFGLMLLQEWKRPAVKYGDGFFNSVLLGMLRKGGFGTLEKTKGMLQRIHRENAPYRGSSAADDCGEMIDGSIGLLGGLLVEKLKYPDQVAVTILDGAVAHVLDRRFRVTERSLLGW